MIAKNIYINALINILKLRWLKMENEVKTEEFLINDPKKAICDIIKITAITTKDNIKVNGYKEIDFNEWKNNFLLNINMEAYVYKDNQAVKYSQKTLENALTNFIGFFYMQKITWKKLGKYASNIKVLFNPNKSMPIIFCLEKEEDKPCLIIAPLYED